MKNKKIKLISTFLLTLIITVFCGGYYVYSNRIIFPDKESEQIIRNVVKNHNLIFDTNGELVEEFNTAVEAFGGVEKISVDNKIVTMNPEGDNVNIYLLDFRYSNNNEFADRDEYYEYISQNYKYYNEDKLKINLELYKYNSSCNFSVEDVKSHINDGDTNKEEEIWDYINWYVNYGKSLIESCKSEFAKILINEDGNGEYTEKYGKKDFAELSVEEQKEVIADFYNKGVILN